MHKAKKVTLIRKDLPYDSAIVCVCMACRKPQVSDPQGSEVVSQISSEAGSVLDYEDGLLKVAHDLYEYPAKH